MLVDTHEDFDQRFERFRAIIRKERDEERKVIEQKTEDQTTAERQALLGEAKKAEDAQHEKRIKNFEVDMKIQKSRRINDMRMSKMKARYELVEEVQEAVKKDLAKYRSNKEAYKELMKQLIKQGLIKLLEENVEIRCCFEDIDLVSELIPSCETEFNSICTQPAKITLNQRQHLANSDLGGVLLTSMRGRIVCNNSLKARLDYAYQMSLPQLRNNLFEK